MVTPPRPLAVRRAGKTSPTSPGLPTSTANGRGSRLFRPWRAAASIPHPTWGRCGAHGLRQFDRRPSTSSARTKRGASSRRRYIRGTRPGGGRGVGKMPPRWRQPEVGLSPAVTCPRRHRKQRRVGRMKTTNLWASLVVVGVTARGVIMRWGGNTATGAPVRRARRARTADQGAREGL